MLNGSLSNLRTFGGRALLFLCVLFIVELFIFGSGQWSEAVFGLNIRKSLFIAIVVISILINVNHTKPTAETVYCIAGTAVLVLIWVLLLPGFNLQRIDYPIRDALPLAGILCIIPLRSLFTREIWSRGRLIFGTSILVTALLQIIYYTVGLVSPELEIFLVEIHRVLLDPLNLDPENAVFASTVDEVMRVNWPGTSMLLVGFYIFCTASELSRPLKILGVLTMLLALYAAQTRALQISAILVVLVHLLAKNFAPSRIRPFHIYSVLAFCALITIPIVLALDPHLLESVGLSRGGSDEERYDQISPLLEAWLQHPFVGQGFGASAYLTRSDEAPFAYEVFVLALLMKVGIFGIALMLLILGNLVSSATRAHERIDANRSSWLLGLVVALAFSTNTNPYLTSLLGTATVAFVLLELQFWIPRSFSSDNKKS